MAELVASAFLGVRLHCARCHQHPYDRWTQARFRRFAKGLSRVEFGSSTELRTAMNERLEQRRQARPRRAVRCQSCPGFKKFLSPTRRARCTDAAAAGGVTAEPSAVRALPDDGRPARGAVSLARAARQSVLCQELRESRVGQVLWRGAG